MLKPKILFLTKNADGQKEFAGLGFEVLRCGSEAEIWQTLGAGICPVIIDGGWPEIAEMVARLRATYPCNYVLVLLGPDQWEDLPRLVESGIDDFLRPGFAQVELKARLAVAEQSIKLRENLHENSIKLLRTSRLAVIGEMAGGIVHEINNPLAIIMGKTENLRRILQKQKIEDGLVSDTVEKILRNCDRVAKIMRGMLALSRDSSRAQFESVTLEEIVSDTLDICGDKLKKHGVALRLPENMGTIAFDCRKTEITQVLLNLWDNSLYAIKQFPSPWIELKARQTEMSVELISTDCGRGVPAEVVPRMMEPFFTTKAIGKGTGLGLSISESLVRNHGGELIYDASCINTCFVIRIPRRQPKTQAA